MFVTTAVTSDGVFFFDEMCFVEKNLNVLFSTIHTLIDYGTHRGSEEIALAPLQVVDCPTQLFHDKYQRTQQGYLPLSRAYLIFVNFGAPPHYLGLSSGWQGGQGRSKSAQE